MKAVLFYLIKIVLLNGTYTDVKACDFFEPHAFSCEKVTTGQL